MQSFVYVHCRSVVRTIQRRKKNQKNQYALAGAFLFADGLDSECQLRLDTRPILAHMLAQDDVQSLYKTFNAKKSTGSSRISKSVIRLAASGWSDLPSILKDYDGL